MTSDSWDADQTSGIAQDMPARSRSVVFKLMLFVAGLLVVAVGAVSTAAYGVARGIIREQIYERLQVAGADRHAMVLAYVSQQHERAGLVASRTKLRQLIQQAADGRIDEDTMRAGTQPILRDALRSTDGFLSITIANPSGQVVTATEDDRVGLDVAELPAFRQGLSTRYLGEPSLQNGVHRAALSAPAKTNEGRVLGVVLVELDVQPLFDILNDTRGLGQTGEVLVGTVDDETVRYLFAPRNANGTGREAAADDVPTMMSAISGQADSEVAVYNGLEVLARYQPIEYQPVEYQSWGLVAKIDVAEAFQPLANLQRVFLLIQIGLLVVGAPATWILARRATRPIRELTETATAVAAGDIGAQVAVWRDDEIGILAQTFNTMTQRLQASYETLEERVRQRTSELTEEIELRKKLEERLREAKDNADSANRAKSEFLANMSHEIRTPLNAVIGLTEVVLRTKLQTTQRDHLRTVIDSAESLLSVINDILDFSKIEAGKLELEEVPFDLHDVVGDTLKALAIRADYKRLELACLIDPDMPSLLIGDPVRLRQVVTNLVGNAIKFTEQGEVVVRVRSESSNDRLKIRVDISDTGIGIQPDQLSRLFEPFSQADASTTRKYGGTGLGLSICVQLVELMGGEINADSTPGQGSTFHFTAEFGISPENRERFRGETHCLAGTRVLIVDDNTTNRTILDEVTRAKEMVPTLADSVETCLQALSEGVERSEPFQLLLSDVHMPDQDGFDLVEAIRKDARFDDLRIIFLTSAGENGDMARCERLRVSDRLLKPVNQSELFEVILRTLEIESRSASDEKLDLDDVRLAYIPPQRILLAEDSKANQRLALAVLNERGHEVTIAENGLQALALLDQQDFDIVLMDVQMPEMDGFDATAQIREREQATGRHQQIIAMTAHAIQGDRERCLEAGMDDYVSKPIRREALFLALAAAVKNMGTTGSSTIESELNVAFPHASTTQHVQDDSSEDSLPLVDFSGLLNSLNGNRTLLVDITASYIEETEDNLRGLAISIEAEEVKEVQRRAHTIKGAMTIYRAALAATAAEQLENLAATGELTGADELFVAAERKVRAVLKRLQEIDSRGTEI